MDKLNQCIVCLVRLHLDYYGEESIKSTDDMVDLCILALNVNDTRTLKNNCGLN